MSLNPDFFFWVNFTYFINQQVKKQNRLFGGQEYFIVAILNFLQEFFIIVQSRQGKGFIMHNL